MNMHRHIGFLLLLSIALSACTAFRTGSPGTEQDDRVIARVDGQPVMYSEMLSQFTQTGATEQQPYDEREAITEFFDLYIDYRLKLAVGRDAGYFDDPSILTEVRTYEEQAAIPFWIERRVRKQLLDELLERSGEMINATHILIEIPDEATPVDTLQAWERLIEARTAYFDREAGFAELALDYSSSRQGQSMGGDLGWFGAGWTVKAFEDVVWKMQPGEVSMPFRSPFGYHVVRINDRRETEPDRYYAHIYFRTQGAPEAADSARVRAERAYQELRQGTPWNEVTATWSEDQSSRTSGGSIGKVDYGMYDEAFLDSLWQVDTPGTFGGYFESTYGLHIARLDSVVSHSDEAVRQELSQRLQQLPRLRDNRRAVRENAAQTAGASWNEPTIQALENDIYSRDEQASLEPGSFSEELLGQVVFQAREFTFTAGDYLHWLYEQSGVQTRSQYHTGTRADFRDFALDSILIPLTRAQFPEFEAMADQYLTGLVVFRVNEDSLWNAAREDTLALKALLNREPNAYRTGERHHYLRFDATTDSTLVLASRMLNEAFEPEQIADSLTGVRWRRGSTRDLNLDEYEPLAALTPGERSPIVAGSGNRHTLWVFKRTDLDRPMTFEEAFNRLVNDYQPRHESLWLERMRELYAVEYYREIFETLVSTRY